MNHRLWSRITATLRQELEKLSLACVFFTRVPVPARFLPSHPEKQTLCMGYASWAGFAVGLCMALVCRVLGLFLTPEVSILLALSFQVLLTGALHEDGFADVCDGFGGAFQKDQVLEIMKDSRVGTYGALGLTFSLLIRFYCLLAVDPAYVSFVIVFGHSASRYMLLFYMRALSYAGHTGRRKLTKPVPGPGAMDFMTGGILPLGVLMVFSAMEGVGFALISLLTLFAGYMVLIKRFRNKIGGYTGDCLGAAQQLSELLIYLVAAGYLS